MKSPRPLSERDALIAAIRTAMARDLHDTILISMDGAERLSGDWSFDWKPMR